MDKRLLQEVPCIRHETPEDNFLLFYSSHSGSVSRGMSFILGTVDIIGLFLILVNVGGLRQSSAGHNPEPVGGRLLAQGVSPGLASVDSIRALSRAPLAGLRRPGARGL